MEEIKYPDDGWKTMYELKIAFVRSPSGQLAARCPLCLKPYQGYLVTDIQGGVIACTRCLGGGRNAAKRLAISRGMPVIINGILKHLDNAISSVIGF